MLPVAMNIAELNELAELQYIIKSPAVIAFAAYWKASAAKMSMVCSVLKKLFVYSAFALVLTIFFIAL